MIDCYLIRKHKAPQNDSNHRAENQARIDRLLLLPHGHGPHVCLHFFTPPNLLFSSSLMSSVRQTRHCKSGNSATAGEILCRRTSSLPRVPWPAYSLPAPAARPPPICLSPPSKLHLPVPMCVAQAPLVPDLTSFSPGHGSLMLRTPGSGEIRHAGAERHQPRCVMSPHLT